MSRTKEFAVWLAECIYLYRMSDTDIIRAFLANVYGQVLRKPSLGYVSRSRSWEMTPRPFRICWDINKFSPHVEKPNSVRSPPIEGGNKHKNNFPTRGKFICSAILPSGEEIQQSGNVGNFGNTPDNFIHGV